MNPQQLEFLAEKEEVTVIPNFSESKICLISGDFGPFNPSMPTKVPLWLAVNLKKQHKCRVQAPEWLCVDELVMTLEAEKESPTFTKMSSPHYMEVAKTLLDNAAEDISQADEVRALVKDLWDVRLAKLRKSVDHMMTEQETYGKLDNLTQMEINTIRPLLTQSLDHAHLLRAYAHYQSTRSQ